MSDSKLPMLQSRLMRRLRHLNLESLEQYRDFLFNSPDGQDERIQFINAVTTNKTDFFREAHHFELLSRVVLPEFSRSRDGRSATRFRLWCAGCSSGEEPYTQAMVLSEYAAITPGFDFSIFATDISTKVLEQARDGIYHESRIDPVPMEFRRRYIMSSCDPSRRLVRIVPELRAKLTLRRLNFMDQHYDVRDIFDTIFFRNVMIYFDRLTQQAVVGRLCRNLKPGGYLFVGHSESLAGLELPLKQVGAATFRKTV
jgi:chemotaxis protein methyltransferase CheR